MMNSLTKRDIPHVRQSLLDRLIAVSPDARDAMIVPIALISIIPVVSCLFSLAIFFLFRKATDQSFDLTIASAIAMIAFVTSLSISLPTVLFTHAMLQRLRRNREQLNEALDAAQVASKAKSDFLANMSHEVRTPLNGVIGMTQVLEAGDLSTHQRDMVSTISDSGRTLMAIVDNILDLSKIEAGRMDITRRDDDLPAVISGTLALFAPKAQEKGIGLDIEIDPSIPEWSSFDGVRVRQCVANLVSNAIKFTSSGGVIVRVSTFGPEDSRTAAISVSDTGLGMSDEEIGRLFTSFSQANENTTRMFGGTGLGLAISRKLARMMGGDIVVTSQSGKGSVFTLTFELAKPETTRKSEPTENAGAVSSMALTGSRVLVVDDNAVNRKVLFMLLQSMRVQVSEAENGKAALELLHDREFDFVLLDVHMPVMDGRETIKRIRGEAEAWSNIPVVALTADAMIGEREKLLAAGMDGYATKPINLHALVSEIERVLLMRKPEDVSRASA